MNKQEIYKKALDEWGETTQLMMAIEEMAELIQAINKYLRADSNEGEKEILTFFSIFDDENLSIETAAYNLLEEIADVEIMIEQIRYIIQKRFSQSDIGKMIDDFKFLKLSRLKGLLGKG